MSQTLALGSGTLSSITSATNNLVVGDNAGLNITTGTNNIYIGNKCGNDQTNESNTLRIGPQGTYVITGNLSTGSVVVSSVTMNNGGVSATSATLSSLLTVSATTNQITLGGANNTKISALAPASSQTVQIPDQSSNLGATSSMFLTTNTTKYAKTGTYTPILYDGTNLFTLSTALGYYSIIGDTVFFTTSITWTSKGAASGNILVTIPFAAFSDGTNYRGASFMSYAQNVTYTGMLGLGIVGGDSFARFISIPSNGTPTSIAASGFGATGSLQVWGFYRTA